MIYDPDQLFTGLLNTMRACTRAPAQRTVGIQVDDIKYANRQGIGMPTCVLCPSVVAICNMLISASLLLGRRTTVLSVMYYDVFYTLIV